MNTTLKHSLECFIVFLFVCLVSWIIGYFSQGTFNVSYWSNDVREIVRNILIIGAIIPVFFKFMIWLL